MLTSTETTPQAKHVFFFRSPFIFKGVSVFSRKRKPKTKKGKVANDFRNFLSIGIPGSCYRASDTRQNDKKQTALVIKS
jgi:hypothetical protein